VEIALRVVASTFLLILLLSACYLFVGFNLLLQISKQYLTGEKININFIGIQKAVISATKLISIGAKIVKLKNV
jgi:hypothetical protein